MESAVAERNAAQRACGLHYQAGTPEKMPLLLKLIFSMPRYTIRSMYTVHSVFVVTYYNGLGAELSQMAFFIALGRSFDALTDPFMGAITDNTRTKIGRRKPYLLIGPITYTIAIMLHVSPPAGLYSGGGATLADDEGGQAGLAMWFGFTYLAFFLFDTAASVPYYSFKYELCTDNVERTKIFMYTIISSFIGLLVGNGMPAGLERFIGLTPGACLQVTMLHFAVIYTLGMWGSALFINEPVRPPTQKKKKFAAMITRVLSTRAVRYFIASETLEYAVIYIFAAVLSLFVNYVIIAPTGIAADYTNGFFWTGIIGLVGFAFSAATPPVWLALYKRIGKRKAWMVQSLYNGFSNVLFLLPLSNNYGLAIVFSLINAFAFGGQFLMDSTLADVIEYDEFLYGDRLDGVFASTAYFLPKAVGAFANALPLTIIYSVGFLKPQRGCPGADEPAAWAAMAAANVTTCAADDIRIQPQPDGALWAIRLCTGLLPAVASMVALGFKFAFYLYPSHMPDISAGIASLKANPTAPVKDPATGLMVTWLTEEMLSEGDRVIKDDLDLFPLSAVVKAKGEGSFAGLWTRSLANFVVLVLFIGASIATTIVTVSEGWLIDRRYAIVPTMGCIFIGVGVTASAIYTPRLLTARRLHQSHAGASFPKQLLAQYCGRFSRGDDAKTASSTSQQTI